MSTFQPSQGLFEDQLTVMSTSESYACCLYDKILKNVDTKKHLVGNEAVQFELKCLSDHFVLNESVMLILGQ